MLSELIQSVRSIRRNPGFALLAIVTLGLGIGISTAVFSVVNGVLLQPLRFSEPERIISINTQNAGRAAFPKVTGGDFVDLRGATEVFDAISMYRGGEVGVQLQNHA